MHAVNLIAKALKQSKENIVIQNDVCCLLGIETECVKRDLVLTPSFTNWDLLKAPSSQYISFDAYVALSYKWERMSSWWCDGESFVRLDRRGVREKVFELHQRALWCGYATTSFKKHGALWTPVCKNGKRIWRFENINVDISDSDNVKALWNELNDILRHGIPRPALATLDISPGLIRKAGYALYTKFISWARPIFHTPLYQFLVYLLPSQEELKKEE